VYTYVTGTNRLAGVSNVFIAPDGTIGMGGNKPAYDSSFAYDGAGNIKEWDLPGLTPVYAYDGFNRMTSVVDTFNGTVPYGEYGYNAFGERTSKRDRRNGNDYSFIYGEGHGLIADKENAVWTNYLWFAGELVAMTRSGATYDIDSDQVGRPELVTNGSKQVVWQTNSQPFGLRVITPSNAIEFNIGFPGQYFDKETNYWYNVNRYYIDALGRYLQPDPIGIAGGLNPYSYADQNPASNTDPLGLSPADLDKILHTFNSSVDQMTKMGLRLPDPWINNTLAYFGAGELMVCSDQAAFVQYQESLNTYDDSWNFEVQPSGPLHWVTHAVSSNPHDPSLILDPWKNHVEFGP